MSFLFSMRAIAPANTKRQALSMAPIEKKRRRDLDSFKAKKRQRIDPEKIESQEGPEGGAIGVDKLPWNQAAVDRLEDAEGFFGLEELSDVDVVRDPTLGKVEYKVCNFTALVLRYTDRSMQLLPSKPANRIVKESKAPDDTAGTDEREWEGFGEEGEEEDEDASRTKGMVPVEKDSRNSEKKRRKQDSNQKKQEASQQKRSSNTFEALGTGDEGGDSADEKESDGKQEERIEMLFCL